MALIAGFAVALFIGAGAESGATGALDRLGPISTMENPSAPLCADRAVGGENPRHSRDCPGQCCPIDGSDGPATLAFERVAAIALVRVGGAESAHAGGDPGPARIGGWGASWSAMGPPDRSQ